MIRAQLPPLLRDGAFRRYWSAITVSALGTGISTLALPLTAVIIFGADSAQMGFLSFLTWLPSLLLSLHLGSWVDRTGRRRLKIILANFGAFLVVGIIPLGELLGIAGMWQLYLAVFATGSFFVLINICDATLFVALVPPTRYVEGQSLIFGSLALASLAGPSLGSLLIHFVSPPTAIAIDAFSFLGAALLLSSIHPAEPPPAGASQDQSLTAGLRFIRRDQAVRSALAVSTTVNFFNIIFQTLLVLYLSRELHAGSGTIGWLLASQAVGGLIGPAPTKRVADRIGIWWTLLSGSVMVSAPLVVVPLVGGSSLIVLAAVAAALLGSGAGRVIQNICIGSIFAQSVPDELRSRVRGAYQMVSIGSRPLGALVGGALGELIGLRPTLWIAVVGGTLAFVWLLPSTVFATRHANLKTEQGPLPEPLPDHESV